MLPTNKFCYVQKGQILEGPFDLPNSHRTTVGLLSLNLKQLKERGYYPVQYKCPTCWGNFDYVVNEELKVVEAWPKEKTVNEFRGRGRNNIEVNYNAINNLTVKRDSFLYQPTADTLALLQANIYLERPGRIPSWSEEGGRRFVELTVLQQIRLLEELVALRSKSLAILDERSIRVEAATTFDEIFEVISD